MDTPNHDSIMQALLRNTRAEFGTHEIEAAMDEIYRMGADLTAANAEIERLRVALAACVGALEPLLERWDRFARSDGNQADAYYNLAKGTHDKWHAARAALTAAKQAMEGGTS